jgi:hypothetical protein
MTYHEFIAALTTEAPSLEDYLQVVMFAESASVEELWAALNTSGIHWIFVAVINKVLQEKIVQANLDDSMSIIAREIKPRGLKP